MGITDTTLKQAKPRDKDYKLTDEIGYAHTCHYIRLQIFQIKLPICG